MKSCPECGSEVPDKAKFCTKCGQKIQFEENTSMINEKNEEDDSLNPRIAENSKQGKIKTSIGDASIRPSITQEGKAKSDLEVSIGDASIRPNITQKGKDGSEIDTNIGDSNVKPSISVMKNEKSTKTGELNKGDIKINIGDYCIKPNLNIVKNTKIFKTFEFLSLKSAIPLYCSNCRERLSDQLNKDNVREINTTGTTTFICKYCGESVNYEEAVKTADIMFTSHGKKMGQIEIAIEELQEKSSQKLDPKLRNYIFQRDVIDYMADKFLKICHFVNVIISDPFNIQEVTSRFNNEIEYGLGLDEYIQIIFTYCELPEHPYIKSLAIGENIKCDSEKQSKKLRSMAYLLKGLINSREACLKLNQGCEFPETIQLLESSEVYFSGAAKLCESIETKFPDEQFFKNFGMLCRSSAKYMKAIRLYSCGYFMPNLFRNANSMFNQIAAPGSMELDSTQISSIFIDPGQTMIREQAEKILEEGTNVNAINSQSYLDKIQAIPGKVRETAKKYKENIEKYIPLKKTITYLKIAQIFCGLLWFLIIFGLWNYPSFFMSNILVSLGFIIGIPLIAFGFESMKQERHRQLNSIKNIFTNIKKNQSAELRRNLALLSFNSKKLVNYLTLPMLKFESFWNKEIENLGEWVFSEEMNRLLSDVRKISIEPGTLSDAPPDNLFNDTKNREDRHYKRFIQEALGSLPFEANNFLTTVGEFQSFQTSKEW